MIIKMKISYLPLTTYFLLFFIACPLFSVLSEEKILKIHFLDVGEGDATLIETPKGRNILIDAGNIISGFKVTEYLKKNNIYNLDYLIFTHPHLDHTGGAFFVLQMMKVKKVYDNGQDLTEAKKSNDVYRWYEELVRDNDRYSILKAGDSFYVDDVYFKVLWPFDTISFSDFNTNSLVVMVEYKKFKYLLVGDATIFTERELLKDKGNLQAKFLKAGHHGALDANSLEFLKIISPQITVISVNKDNIYGYPSGEVVRRLEDLNSKIYCTDVNGDVVVFIGEQGNIKVKTERR